MLFKSMEVGMLASNCYLVGCSRTRAGVVIDPGAEGDRISREIESMGLSVMAIINTHGHYDHVGGNGRVKASTGAPIILHSADGGVYKNPGFGLSAILKKQPKPDKFVADNDTVDFGDLKLTVLETPGHTPGGISLFLNGNDNDAPMLFSGDTLFNFSIGRFDLPGGSFNQLIDSIKNKLLVLPDNTKVYPGHGPASTIGQEKSLNPFLR